MDGCRTRLIVRISVAAAAALLLAADAMAVDDPFASCRQTFAGKPDDYESAYCFYEVTAQKNLWDEGARVFDALIAEHPSNLWLPLAYGHVYRTREPARAEALYRQSAEGFQRAGHAEGEILARSNLRNFLFPKGRVDDAARETARVADIGRSVSDPMLKARAWTLEATHVQDTGGDLALAYRLLKQTEDVIFPNGPYRLKRSTLNSLGLVAFRLGRLDQALAVFQKLDELAAAEGEALARANAQYNILNTSTLKESLLPSPGGRERLLVLAERSLATAVSAQNRDVTLKTHRALGELLARDPETRATALAHVESCLALAVKLHQPHDEAVCSWVKASLLSAASPRESRIAERQALDATERAHSPRTQAYSAGRRMRISWAAKPRAAAVADSLAAIDSIETLRSLQEDLDGSAEQFSTWTSDYHWLSGRLLQDGNADDLELGFAIVERMRARSLLDSIERKRVRVDAAAPVVRTRREILERIARVQQKLMNPDLADSARQPLADELQDLELRELDARREIGISFPAQKSGTTPFADMRALQAALRPNEALLSFQVALWKTFEGEFGGGAWLVSLTRDARTVHRLPDRVELAHMVPLFRGLIERGDGLDAAAGVRLYALLLGGALDQLPSSIQRLILVPDGPLHHLPFDALRSPDGIALGQRYELSIVPSATLWRHWREKGPHTPTHRSLAFADPVLEVSVSADATERGASIQRGLRLGRLPYARRETDAIGRYLGGVDALVGSGASEKALKGRNLRDYDILHFAVHAVADDGRPERSAVLLAPGASNEDGLLQSREIEELDLDRRVVVLSACETASGTILSGEGVLSLARAFFEAGATTVIGSRWPIRDRDAASLFESFYRQVGRGASLSEALKAAKQEAIAAERPASAWASLVLLGDGDFRPFPHGRTEPAAAASRVPLMLALGFLVLCFAGWRWLRRASVTHQVP